MKNIISILFLLYSFVAIGQSIRLYSRTLTVCEINDLYEKERLSTTAINEPTHQDFSIYPNPTQDKLTINLKNTEGSIKVKATITDITGRTIIQHSINAPQTDIDVKSLVNGL